MKRDEPLDNENRLVKLDAFDESARLVAAFSRASTIGLAIFDNQLRYRAVNKAGAVMSGFPAEDMMGNTLRDMIGGAAAKLESASEQLSATGQSLSFEVTALLPTRTEPGSWISHVFPCGRGAEGISQICVLAVDVSDVRKLEGLFAKLSRGVLTAEDKGNRCLGRELQDSINQYCTAVAMNLTRLSEHIKRPENIPELLAQSMERLDERMQTLASVIAKSFAIHQQH